MRTMTLEEAKDAFERLAEMAKREGVMLREGSSDVLAVISADEYARFRQWQVDGLLEVMDKVAAEAAANGLTEEKLAELLKQPD
jgi:hypothetical protein